MKNFDLVQFASDLELANAVAAAWLREVEATTRKGAMHYVALSGGRIARQFFAALVEQTKRKAVSLAGVHFFWADERCLPPTDPESNYGIARQILFEPLRIRRDQIHRIHGEDSPQSAAVQATAELRRVVPADPSGQPVLDFVFLGLGEDGHIASLFPGEPDALVGSPAIYRAVVATKPPPNRITLGYAPITTAAHVWVLASGKGKEQALGDSLAMSMRLIKPLTPALSPSDGERECAFPPVERSLFSDAIHDQAKVLPLPFLKGEGRGEGSRPLPRYGLAERGPTPLARLLQMRASTRIFTDLSVEH